MFLMESVVFRLVWERQTALDDEKQLKLGSLTMTASVHNASEYRNYFSL